MTPGEERLCGRTYSQNVQLKITAKQLVFGCHLAHTINELNGLVTVTPLLSKLADTVSCSPGT